MENGLTKGAPVFVRVATDSWSLGTLLENPSADGCLVKMNDEGSDAAPRRVGLCELAPANSSSSPDEQDICSLSFLHEPAVTHNLRVRYDRGEIYTRAGPVLVAVNPFENLGGLYSAEKAACYAEAEATRFSSPSTSSSSSTSSSTSPPPPLPPHIFETASRAYSAMVSSGLSQSIIISGESGAGKTESAKLALRQVAALASSAAASSSSSSSSASAAAAAGDEFAALEAAILATNPVLEAFGNAKTSRNANSSRFGKLVELVYDRKKPNGGTFVVSGARLSTCLLERSRLVARPEGERNFHVLYQLVAGAGDELRKELQLPEHSSSSSSSSSSTSSFFRYLSGGPEQIEGVDDAAEFRRVVEALTALGVGEQQQQKSLWRALAGVLFLGNVDFESAKGGEACEVSSSSSSALETAASLLGVQAEELESVLTTREITAGGGGGSKKKRNNGGRRNSSGSGGGDRVVKLLRPEEARSSRDALAKAVYSCLFDWLVARINDRLAPKKQEEKEVGEKKAYAAGDKATPTSSSSSPSSSPSSSSPFISLLDIYGFECFTENGFEQLCINYANEHLQAQFNSVLLALEQEAYEGEGVDFSRVEWKDNQETLAALDARPGNNAAAGLVNSSSSSQFSVGLLALLDEACLVPGGTDKGFGLRVSEVLAGGGGSSSSSAASTPSSAKAAAAKTSAFASSSASVISGCPAGAGASFSVAHAAGNVSYSTSGFLSKNKDVVSAEALALLSRSTEPLMKEIAATNAAGGGSKSSNSNNATVVSAFRLQLRALLSRLDASQLHFVRCIKPNSRAAAKCFDQPLVAHQLRCAGVAEVARVARQGFPSRLPYSELARRFSALVVAVVDDAEDDKTTVSALLSSKLLCGHHHFGEDDYALGRTKVFMRAGVLAALEAALRVRSSAATVISAGFRSHRQRVAFLKVRRSAVSIQAAARGRAARKLLAAKREEKRKRLEEEEEEERARAKAEVAVERSSPSANDTNDATTNAASVLRGAEKLVEAADAEAAAAVKRAEGGGGEAKKSSSGSSKWQLPKVPLSLRRNSRSNEGGSSTVTPRPPAPSGAVAEVALWEAYAERLEAQVASLLRTNRALQGSLSAARIDALSLANGNNGNNNGKKKSCFSSCSSSTTSSPSRLAATEHAASLRALDALHETLNKREALFEDDAAFLEEVASGAVAAAPGFQLLEETRRLRKRFGSFVSSFKGKMEATEVVVLGAAEAKRAREEQGRGASGLGAAATASGGESISSRQKLIAAAAALQQKAGEGGGGKISTERQGVSLEARAGW